MLFYCKITTLIFIIILHFLFSSGKPFSFHFYRFPANKTMPCQSPSEARLCVHLHACSPWHFCVLTARFIMSRNVLRHWNTITTYMCVNAALVTSKAYIYSVEACTIWQYWEIDFISMYVYCADLTNGVYMCVCYCKHAFPASLLLGHTGWQGAQTNQLPFSWILKGISARLAPWDPAATLSSIRSGAKSIRSRHIISEAHNRKPCPWSEPILDWKGV